MQIGSITMRAEQLELCTQALEILNERRAMLGQAALTLTVVPDQTGRLPELVQYWRPITAVIAGGGELLGEQTSGQFYGVLVDLMVGEICGSLNRRPDQLPPFSS